MNQTFVELKGDKKDATGAKRARDYRRRKQNDKVKLKEENCQLKRSRVGFLESISWLENEIEILTEQSLPGRIENKLLRHQLQVCYRSM